MYWKMTWTVSVLAFQLVVGSLHAGVIPGRWEKVDSQPPGTQLTIVLRSGMRMEGRLQATDGESLSIEGPGGRQRLPKAEVLQVFKAHRNRTSRSVWVGLAVGFGVGAAFGAAGSEGTIFDLSQGATIPIGGAIGAAAGALAGYGIDRITAHPERLYQAP